MLIYVVSSSVPLARTTTSPSDKGSRIKVEDTTNYVDNRLGHLQEASVYRQYVGDSTEHVSDSTEHVSESIGRFLDDLYSREAGIRGWHEEGGKESFIESDVLLNCRM